MIHLEGLYNLLKEGGSIHAKDKQGKTLSESIKKVRKNGRERLKNRSQEAARCDYFIRELTQQAQYYESSSEWMSTVDEIYEEAVDYKAPVDERRRDEEMCCRMLGMVNGREDFGLSSSLGFDTEGRLQFR